MQGLDILDTLSLGAPVTGEGTGMIPILSPEPVAPEYGRRPIAYERPSGPGPRHAGTPPPIRAAGSARIGVPSSGLAP